MAARTASVSGKWSQTATWGGSAVPVDADTFTINAGVLVEFDVDQSGFAAGLGASTINGTLYGSRTAGTYYLKMNAALTIGSGGVLDASDGSGGAYPSTCTWTLKFATGFGFSPNTGCTINLVCGEPTHKYARLSQAESAAATILHIDTDLTSGADATWWASPNEITICNINGAIQTEARTISSVTSTTVVITAGLTNSKLIGSFVILTNRNVKIIGGSTASGIAFIGGPFTTQAIIGAEIRTFQAFGSPSNVIVNGVIVACGQGSQNGQNQTVHGPIVAVPGSAFNLSYNANVYDGLIVGCGAAVSGSGVVLNNAIIAGCTTGVTITQFAIARGTQFIGNTSDISSSEFGTLHNCLLGSTTEFSVPTSGVRSVLAYIESFDHDQVVGAYKAWCRGGNVVNDATVYDASRARSFKHSPTSASLYVFMKREVLLPAGASLYVRCYVQKDASMSYLPRLWVYSSDKEPLLSGSPNSEVIMTNSTNTWEILETTVTNSTDLDRYYTVQTLAKNASGNVYFDPIIRLNSFQIGKDMVGGLVA